MIHQILTTWFSWVEQWGYSGVFILMAMESSVIPVPSEIVMPPAAFWAAQGRMSFFGVVAAGTAGSYFGSAVSYWVAQALGRPFIRKFGKFLHISTEKLEIAETWVQRFGVSGIFFARLLPVVRHLISIPAGILRMNFLSFSVVTTLGAGIWCTTLAWLGAKVIGDRPELLESPEAMVSVIKDRVHWIAGAVLTILLLYVVAVSIDQKRKKRKKKHSVA